jgi:hypothetical protein
MKYKDVATHRISLLAQQGGCCALCLEPIIDDAVLDHDHKSGLIRAVLHRGCNALLGKLENNLARNKMSDSRLRNWSNNVVGYISKQHTELIHPTHKIKAPKAPKKSKVTRPKK